MKSGRVWVRTTVVCRAGTDPSVPTLALTKETVALSAVLAMSVVPGTPIGEVASSRSQQHERLAAGACDLWHPSWDAGC